TPPPQMIFARAVQPSTLLSDASSVISMYGSYMAAMRPAPAVIAKKSSQRPAPSGSVLSINDAIVSANASPARRPPRQSTNAANTGSQFGLHASSPTHTPASTLRPVARPYAATPITSAALPNTPAMRMRISAGLRIRHNTQSVPAAAASWVAHTTTYAAIGGIRA